jgi:hypothetical protein
MYVTGRSRNGFKINELIITNPVCTPAQEVASTLLEVQIEASRRVPPAALKTNISN